MSARCARAVPATQIGLSKARDCGLLASGRLERARYAGSVTKRSASFPIRREEVRRNPVAGQRPPRRRRASHLPRHVYRRRRRPSFPDNSASPKKRRTPSTLEGPQIRYFPNGCSDEPGPEPVVPIGSGFPRRIDARSKSLKECQSVLTNEFFRPLAFGALIR